TPPAQRGRPPGDTGAVRGASRRQPGAVGPDDAGGAPTGGAARGTWPRERRSDVPAHGRPRPVPHRTDEYDAGEHPGALTTSGRRPRPVHPSATPSSASSFGMVMAASRWRTPAMPTARAPSTFDGRSSTNTHRPGETSR